MALEWLAAHPLVDAARIALVGLSLGGWVAPMLASRTKGVKAVVALSPLIDPTNSPIKTALLEAFAESVRGISAEKLVAEWQALPPITDVAGPLADVPILLVTADGDEIFPPSHYAALPALPYLTRVRFPRADHAFSDVRPGLRHIVGGWLLEQLE